MQQHREGRGDRPTFVSVQQEGTAMNKKMMTATALAAALAAGGASAQVLDEVRNRGELRCGSNTGLAGFAAPDQEGRWIGFDIDYCRAIAAAVLDDPEAVEFVPTTPVTRFEALSSGEIDTLARNTTWTFTRDVDLNFTFIGVNYYDGQGFMVRSDLGVESALELDGATVCIQSGTTTELNLSDFFRANAIEYEPVPVETNAEGQLQYLAGACDAYTDDVSSLAAQRATFDDPAAHVILPEVISKEPLGPVVRHGDDQWADLNRWVLYALMAAEEKGVTQENVRELAESGDTGSPDINRLLGIEAGFGEMLGLDDDWALRAIEAVGNYGELFERHLAPLGLERGLNALWTEGGLHYPKPFR
jgi:general L-amino acid transport system substrate-binding protein